MGRLGALLDLSDAVLEVSWALLGLSWAVLGASEALLGPSWAENGPKWGRLDLLGIGTESAGSFCECARSRASGLEPCWCDDFGATY